MKISKGLAQINGKWVKVDYPFERTIRQVKRDLKIIDNNVAKLIIEEYTLISQKKGKRENNKFSFTIWYPRAVYRFKRFITKDEL